MSDSPAVLLLVRDSGERESVRQRLTELEVMPIVVRADRATAAIERYRPVAAVLDRPHAALAPDDFLECARTNRMRLVTLPEGDVEGSVTRSLLQSAISTPSLI
jgi:hypothetical protein